MTCLTPRIAEHLGLDAGTLEVRGVMCDQDNSVASACAGKSMALDTIWIAIASVLSVYNITKAVDERGNVITPRVKLQPGTVRYVHIHTSVEDDWMTPNVCN
jgi:hypothetical protein